MARAHRQTRTASGSPSHRVSRTVDGSDLDFPDTSQYTTSDILSDIYTRASDLDFDYAAQGKALEFEQ